MQLAGRPARRLVSLLLVLGALIQVRAQQQDAEGWFNGTIGQLGFGSGYTVEQGGCGYGQLPDAQWPYGFVGAIDPATSPLATGRAQQGCGICIEVECTDAAACGSGSTAGQPPNTLVILVTDQCTGCGAGSVYLAPAAYNQVAAGTALGQVGGRFRRVNCKPPADVAVHVDQYRTTAGSWVRLALTGVAGDGDITKIELAPSETPDRWLPMQRNYGASWDLSSLPSAPLDLRATDGSGQQIVARRVLQQAGQTGNFRTGAQFQATQALASALGGSSSPAPSPAQQQMTFGDVFKSPSPVPGPAPLPAPAPKPEAAPAPAPAPAPTVQLVSPSPGAPSQPTAQPPVDGAPTPAITLPQPAAGTPTVPDTRPPRPPGVAPSVAPAPVSFTRASGLPTLAPQSPTTGPAAREQVAAAGSISPGSCSTLGDILSRIPQASNWTQLLTRVGLDVLLRDKNARVTLLVPVNSALNAGIDARPLRNETTLSELILNAPEIENPLVGYHVLPGLWPSYALQSGAQIDTSDTIDKVNRLKITAQGPTLLRGIGTSANILQADIVSCGPSVVHIIDQVLLPFTFDQAAIDAISGTQAPLPGTPVPAGK